MIITISGNHGSGKSTVAKAIAKKLKLKHYSMGDLQRRFAKERGITIEALGELEAKDKKLDKKIDEHQSKLGKKEDNFIIDSLLGFYFIPGSIKIFLSCDIKEAAKRIFNDKRDSSERKTKSVKEEIKILKQRAETNTKRFLKYYKVDFLDMKNYDLVINTTKISAEKIVEKIVNFVSTGE
jgi:cytidylate kinase